MPTIQSFKALRPSPEKAGKISARSSGGETPEQIAEFLKANPQSFLNVVKPHLLVGDLERIPEKHYPIAVEYLKKLQKEGHLIQDQISSVYLYQQIKVKENQSFTGLICLVSIDDYLNGKIKKHENTRTQKEIQLAHHVEVVKAIGEPVLLTHQKLENLNSLYDQIMEKNPDYDFETEATLRHKLWVVEDSSMISKLKTEFNQLDAFYIGDGHHRSAGAGLFGQTSRKAKPDYDGSEGFNYFLACLIPADNLNIVAFHRLVNDLKGLEPSEFLKLLEEDFAISKSGHEMFKPSQAHTFGLYLNKNWYRLELKKEKLHQDDVLFNLDVSLIETYILKKHLGINDSKTDQGISFMEGSKSVSDLIKEVDEGRSQAAFTLYPTRISEVIEIADKGMIMPPKSTWIEPKLRTGLIVQKFEEL